MTTGIVTVRPHTPLREALTSVKPLTAASVDRAQPLRVPGNGGNLSPYP